MLKLFVRALGLIAALALSGSAYAIGMGDISVASALGEPLKAEIALTEVGQADRNNLSVRLASPKAFWDAGMDYSSVVPNMKFQIKMRADGEPYLSVTSEQPVKESFVSFLVELAWPSGKLLREYSFLLDPPGFKPEQPKGVGVRPLGPSVANADETAGRAEYVAPGKKAVRNANAHSGFITVKRGDSLSKIALETKSPDVSLERMLVALYRANEDAFEDKNMYRLKAGTILHLPNKDDLNALEQAAAEKEIRIQTTDWNAYRLKLAAASGSVTEREPSQEISGKIADQIVAERKKAKEDAKAG